MKTINKKSSVVFTVLLGLALLFTHNIATGQGRSRSERKPHDREYTRTGTRHERDRGDNNQNRYQHGGQRNHNDGYKKHQKNNNHSKHRDHYAYKKHKKHHKHHNSSVTVYWNIPKYYYRDNWDHRKPWRHHHQRPVVLHDRYGRVYYHNNVFYRYDNIYGYVVIEQPSHLIFTTVPSDFNRVRIRGNIYYRHRDIWMEWTPRGYRLWRG